MKKEVTFTHRILAYFLFSLLGPLAGPPALAREKLSIFNAREVTFYGKGDPKPRTLDAVDKLRTRPLFNATDKHRHAKEFYRASCAQDHVVSCVITGMFEYDEGNRERASLLFSNACDEGDAIGCRNLGLLDAREGRLPASLPNLEKGCDFGDPETCEVLRAVRNRLLDSGE